MSQISLQNIRIAFGGPALLENVSCDIHKGQRISFLGRNGAGKSTFMKIIAGIIIPDSGEIINAQGVRVSYLPQDVPEGITGTVYDVVARGAGEAGALLAELHHATIDHENSEHLATLHHAIQDIDGWSVQTSIERVLSQTGLDGSVDFTSMSGGMRRRVLLARALVRDPDLLLLDEPTNHLDLESIAWLESFILSSKLTVLFVTHDRRLLKRLATRIIELDRGKLFDWSCDYQTFLERKQAVLDSEEKSWDLFDKKLSQEEIWVRKGVKARRCRNEGRVRALIRMRQERSKRRDRSGTVSMSISEADRSGAKVIDAKNLSFSYGSNAIISNFNLMVMRGERIGIIGPNGCGKTTLINLLLGKVAPQGGTVEIGTNVDIVYFDQFRNVLDPEKTVWENVAPGGGDTVFVNNSPKHVMSYLQDFLFTSERARSPVKQLSGGERNRLLLARMFTQPSNLLLLDEPTNDLDTETLELLEELLATYSGTILVVSHDREFINNTVTSTLVFEGNGIINEYVGGYDDWEQQVKSKLEKDASETKVIKESKPIEKKVTKKRSYREQQEFEGLPALIDQWERELEEHNGQMANPENYRKPGFAVEVKKQIGELEGKIAAAFHRWEELEGKNST
jgi:ATP-binding cassette subfamily F protein uup